MVIEVTIFDVCIKVIVIFLHMTGADCDRVIREIEEIIGLDCTNILKVSAKMGVGIEETLEAVVRLVPPPKNNTSDRLRALIFDSYYDAYRGVVCQFRVTDGSISKGDVVRMMNTGKEYQLDEIGVLAPHKIQVDTLYCGEVGYLAAQIKSVKDARVGDTVTTKDDPADEPVRVIWVRTAETMPEVFISLCGLLNSSPQISYEFIPIYIPLTQLAGYEDVQPMVYCGLFPTSADDYQVRA